MEKNAQEAKLLRSRGNSKDPNNAKSPGNDKNGKKELWKYQLNSI